LTSPYTGHSNLWLSCDLCRYCETKHRSHYYYTSNMHHKSVSRKMTNRSQYCGDSDLLLCTVWCGLRASCTVNDDQSAVSGLCTILFMITWVIVLLRNRPTVRPHPAQLITPDQVVCEPKSMTRATPQII